MKYATFLIAVAAGAMLTGCYPDPTTSISKFEVEPTKHTVDNRFQITRVGVFEDDLAYGARRGVYLIVDKDTGTEYIGVSGVGISERGSHSNGKIRATDER